MTRKHYQIPGKSKDFFYEEFHIQKKKGKTRRICAPSPALLAEQRTNLPELEREYERKASVYGVVENVHGFLKNRNIVTAAMQHIGYANTIQMDISKCFDSIFDNTLLPSFSHEDGSLAQGFATSPILANIYLINPIAEIKTELAAFGIECAITSYADDLAISTNETDYNIINIIPEIVTVVMKKYELGINPSKTRIRYSKYGNRKILGIMVGEYAIHPSRKLKGKIRAARHQGNGPSLGGLVTASRNYLPRALR